MSGTAIITSLGAQGDGLLPDGAHLPFTLPGEQVRLADNAILNPSPDRVTPPCRHFGTCGGCGLQHASDAFVAEWKRDLIARSLAQRGIAGVEIAPTLTSPPGSRRRVAFAGRRTRSGAIVGFHRPGSSEIVPLVECKVAAGAIVATLPLLADLTRAGASRKGELRFTVTDYAGGPEIAVEGAGAVDGPLTARLLTTVQGAGLSRLVWDGEVLASFSTPAEPMGRAAVMPPPGAFLQATREGAAALVAGVAAHLSGARRIADLFAGVGTFALPLAEAAAVRAVESDADAMEALDQAWRAAPGLHQIETERRDLFRRPLLTSEFKGIEAVVIDPPRQGARAQCEELARSDLSRIAMVSCNPATFARDARTLIDGGFALLGVQPVDQFRWSPHVELLARFARR